MGKIFNKKSMRLVLSFTCAIFLWAYVANTANPIINKTISSIPISLKNIESLESQNLAINLKSIKDINVVVKGRYTDVSNISSNEIKASIDFKDLALKEGINELSLDIQSLDRAVSIVKEKSPLQASIQVEKLLQKQVPVNVVIQGDLKEGFSYSTPILSKEQVIVSGTKDNLRDLNAVTTTIDISNTEETITSVQNLVAIDKYGNEFKDILLKDNKIEITVPIHFSKSFDVIVDIKGEPSNGYYLDNVFYDTKTVTLTGEKKYFDNVTAIYTEPIELSSYSKTFNKTLNLIIPENLKTESSKTNISVTFSILNKKMN